MVSEGLENSSYHKQQTLGSKSQYLLRLKLPPMRSDFVSRSNFFKKPLPTEEKPAQSQIAMIERHRLSVNRGTNTLTYSDTLPEGASKDQHQKLDSEYQTVFKLTDKHSKADDEVMPDDDNESQAANTKVRHSVPSQITKSHYFEGRASLDDNKEGDQVTKSNFLDSKVSSKDRAKDQDESLVINQSELKAFYDKQRRLVPEYLGVWFQFHTEAIYCNITSLYLVREDIEYDVPFAIAKIALRSNESLVEFLNHCDYLDKCVLHIDYKNLESIKNREVINEQDFELDYLDVKGTRIKIE